MSELEQLIHDLTSGDETKAEAAALQIGTFGRKATRKLLPLVEHSISDIRWWSIRALAEIEDPSIPPVFTTKLDEDCLEIRQCAALALRKQPDPQAVAPLLRELNSSDPLMARLAGDALVSIGEVAVEPLIVMLQSGTAQARVEAARSLALIADDRAVPALFSVLDEDSAMLEYWANEGLERMGVGMVYVKP